MLVRAFSIPRRDYCPSRPEPVKGAYRRPFGQPLTEPGRLSIRRLIGGWGRTSCELQRYGYNGSRSLPPTLGSSVPASIC